LCRGSGLGAGSRKKMGAQIILLMPFATGQLERRVIGGGVVGRGFSPKPIRDGCNRQSGPGTSAPVCKSNRLINGVCAR